ncbi:twitching motility protein PilT [Bacteroidia bacterium]|nr:twitching motility protein PilT [Bacteroidia bacterium]
MDTRHLLDTNVVLFFLIERDELSLRVRNITEDYNNVFYVSMISVVEMTHLVKAGKFRKKWKSPEEIMPALAEANFILLPIKPEHLDAYARLQATQGHNDPFDHIIISQAIAERIPLISSDHKFEDYVNQKLTLIFNER